MRAFSAAARVVRTAIVALVPLGMAACESTVLDVDEIVVTGTVVDATSGAALQDAVVRVVNVVPEVVTQTNAAGEYGFSLEVSKTLDLVVIASKEAYVSDTTSVVAAPGRDIVVPQLLLSSTSGSASGATRTGPKSVVLTAIADESILVKESGGQETTDIIFEVRDSAGLPLDLNTAVQVTFHFGAAPGGGETLFPYSATTNALGRVTTSLHSGTAAGVVQVVAEIDYNGTVLRSRPASVAIHGGLPDAAHFGVGAERFNMPFVRLGETTPVTAIAGDKYGNIATPGTAIYFSSTGGIIEGSAPTDAKGAATVDLIANNPYPVHPDHGPGYAVVRAQTADENDQTIQTETLVLLSGRAQISNVAPTTFAIPNGGSQAFAFTVSDAQGHPLSAGTTIEVTADGGSVDVAGNVSITLDDNLWGGQGITGFSFVVSDSDATITDTAAVTITIRTTGDNGTAQVVLSGTAS
jgi:hypothetical protein